MGRYILKEINTEYIYIKETLAFVNRSPLTGISLIRHNQFLTHDRFEALSKRIYNDNVDYKKMCDEYNVFWAMPYVIEIREVYKKIVLK